MLVRKPLGATPSFSHIVNNFPFSRFSQMHPLHMTNNFYKSRGEGFSFGGESDRQQSGISSVALDWACDRCSLSNGIAGNSSFIGGNAEERAIA